MELWNVGVMIVTLVGAGGGAVFVVWRILRGESETRRKESREAHEKIGGQISEVRKELGGEIADLREGQADLREGQAGLREGIAGLQGEMKGMRDSLLTPPRGFPGAPARGEIADSAVTGL